MHRIDTPGNVANRFTVGDPAISQIATQLGADWPNAVQEELIAVVAQGGLIPNKAILTQVRDAILAMVAAAAAPIGTVRMWSGLSATVPAGHLLCNGALVSRTTYAALFAVTSTKYGAGDGSTTFALPDLRAKFVHGATIDADVASLVGANTVTATMQAAGSHNHGGNSGSHVLTTAEIPAHHHAYDALIGSSTHPTGSGSGEARGQVTNQDTADTGGGGGHTHTISTQADHTHTMNSQDNRPASVEMYFIIRSI